MNKPFVGIIHIGVHLYELEETGELGLSHNPYIDKDIGNILIKLPPGTKEDTLALIKDKLQQIEAIKHGNNEV